MSNQKAGKTDSKLLDEIPRSLALFDLETPSDIWKAPRVSRQDLERILNVTNLRKKRSGPEFEASFDVAVSRLDHVARYYSIGKKVRKLPSVPESRQALKKIHDDAVKLYESLEGLDWLTRLLLIHSQVDEVPLVFGEEGEDGFAVVQVNPRDVLEGFRFWRGYGHLNIRMILRLDDSKETNAFETFRELLAQFCDQAKAAFEGLPKPSKKRTHDRDAVIDLLMLIYTDLTGLKPGLGKTVKKKDGSEVKSSPFFRFVKAFFQHLGEETNDETLFGSIRSVLRASR